MTDETPDHAAILEAWAAKEKQSLWDRLTDTNSPDPDAEAKHAIFCAHLDESLRIFLGTNDMKLDEVTIATATKIRRIALNYRRTVDLLREAAEESAVTGNSSDITGPIEK